jgi:GAF domain-containing protein
LAVFGFITFRFSPLGYPVGHVGTFLNACVLTYAVVAHRLLDIRVILRRTLMYLVLYGGGLAIVLLFFFLANLLFGFKPDFATLGVAMGLGIPVIFYLAYKVRDILQRKMEEAFVGERYPYRRQLSDFVTKIHNAPTLEHFGSEFISLLSQSINCRRACLLLPQAGNGGFSARFIYPPVEDNPMNKFKLRQDSPIVTWLKQENTILPGRNLSIFPEFQSIWEEEREEIRSTNVAIFVPLTNRGELVAVLAVGERSDGKLFAVEDIDLLESIAAQVAASMEKEYFHEQLREQDKEITLINRLTTIITSNVSIQEIFEGFA